MDKTDNQTRPNWNGAATNELERVGVVPLGLDVPKNPVFMWVSGLGTFRATVFATDKIVPLGLQLNLKIAYFLRLLPRFGQKPFCIFDKNFSL